MSLYKHFKVSMENDSTDTDIVNSESDPVESSTIREKEICLYIRLLDFQQFKKASHAEHHEQWEVKIPKTDSNASEGKIRVRRIQARYGKVSFEITIKNKGKEGSYIESTLPCTEEVFTQIAFLAENGMKKQRYTFPIANTDMQWEIDLYPDGKEGFYTWARAELEIKGDLESIPELPIQAEETITPEEAKQDDSRVRELFERYFLRKNKYRLETRAEDTFVDKEDNADESTGKDDTTLDTDHALPSDTSSEGDTENPSQGESNPSTDEVHPSTPEEPTDETQVEK